MKRYISFTSANKSSTWNMYSQLQQNTKIVEAFYKSELQRIVKVILVFWLLLKFNDKRFKFNFFFKGY